ncbi:MAG: glycosyltransferase family 2 protein [Parvibaculaceae bacterium]
MAEGRPECSISDLGIIVVSYNTREMTLEALRALKRETDPALYELIVVDNASSDGSAEAIAAEFPDFRLIALDENIGFAKANNLAADMMCVRYLLLLNPDTIILDNAVGKLFQFAVEHPRARIWGGRTLFSDKHLNPSSCWNRMTLWSLFCQFTGLKALFPGSRLINSEAIGNWERDSVREVDIISGCFLMIEKSLWQSLKGFDTGYFMYGEDANLCLRAKSMGAIPVVCPHAELIHYGGASEQIRAEKMVRLLTAKTTLMRHHWSVLTRFFGHAVFWAFPLPRILGYGLARFLRGRTSDQENLRTWLQIWRARRDWLSGYPTTTRPSR